MTKKLLKYLGWFCLFCILLIGKVFVTEILLPARNKTHPTKPILEYHLPPQRFFGETFVPTQDPSHPRKLTVVSHLVQPTISSLAFTSDGKYLLGLYPFYGHNVIKRWDVNNGQELSPIQSRGIGLLSSDGRFYASVDFVNHQTFNQRLHRTSDQTVVASLPKNTKDRQLKKITAGANPLAIYTYVHTMGMHDIFSGPKNVKRGYLIWNIHEKHFIYSTPYTTILYDVNDISQMKVAFSNDGTKALSLWPTYSAIGMNETIEYTHNLNPWPDAMELGSMKPKEARLLNEINGKTIKLPFSDKNIKYGNDFEWDEAALSRDQKYFAAASSNYHGTVWCYDLSNRQLKWKYSQELTFPRMLMFSPNGTMVAVGGYDMNYRQNGVSFLNVIDVKTGKLFHSYTEQTLSQQVRDRTRIYLLGKLLHIPFLHKKFSRISFAMQSPAAPGNSGQIQDIAWSPDSKTLAASYYDGSVKIWRVTK